MSQKALHPIVHIVSSEHNRFVQQQPSRPYDPQNSFYNNKTNSSQCSMYQTSPSPQRRSQSPINLSTQSNRYIQPPPFNLISQHQLEASPSPIRTAHKSKNNSVVSVSINHPHHPSKHSNHQDYSQISPPKTAHYREPNLPPRIPSLQIDQRGSHSPITPQYRNNQLNHQLTPISENTSVQSIAQQVRSHANSKKSLGQAQLMANDITSELSMATSRERLVSIDVNNFHRNQQSTMYSVDEDKLQNNPSRKQLLSQMNNLKDILNQHTEKENRSSHNSQTYQQLTSTIILLHAEIDRLKQLGHDQQAHNELQAETYKNIIIELQEKSDQLLKENENLNCVLKEQEFQIQDLQDRMDRQPRRKTHETHDQEDYRELKNRYTTQEAQCLHLAKENERLASENKQLHGRRQNMDMPLQSQPRETGKLVEAIQDLNQEIELWKQKFIEADRRNEEMPMLEISLKNTQTTVMDLEQRIRAVLCENEKLKISATEKVQYQVKVQHLTKEQTRLKQELTELEEQYQLLQQKHDAQDKRAKKMLEDLEQSLRHKRELEQALESQRQNQHNAEKQREEKEQEIQDAQTHIHKLSAKLHEKDKEHQTVITKYRHLLQELQEMKDWRSKCQTSLIDAREAKFNAERVAFETHITQLKEKLVQYEHANTRLAEENERLIHSLQEKSTQIDIIQSEIAKLSHQYSESIEGVRRDLERQKAIVIDNETDRLKIETAYQQQETAIRQMHEMLKNYKDEQEKLYGMIQKRKDEYDQVVKLVEEKKREVQKQQKYNMDLQGNLRQANEKIDHLQRDVDELCRNRDDYRQQSERYSMEVTKKNKELVQKIEELNGLKVEYEESLVRLQDLEQKLILKLQTNHE